MINWADKMQVFQDWFTQQWVIVRGQKINVNEFQWLVGPFGNVNGIGEEFLFQLAEKEGLVIDRNQTSKGLINPFSILNLSDSEKNKLSLKVIDFYENTSAYKLQLRVKWNLFFVPFGWLVNRLFSNRINQLNIPFKIKEEENLLKSEIITLIDPQTNKIKYTFWLRTETASGKVMYSGIYSTCKLPNGITCVKAVFPLPNGNATVIMKPTVGSNGSLILHSIGKKVNDAGFYFLLKDAKGSYWTNFISSFQDRLTIQEYEDELQAMQILTLYGFRVLTLNYRIILNKKDK